MRIILVVTIFLISSSVYSQRPVNMVDNKGSKQGLWIQRENGFTKSIQNYFNDTLHGFSILFNDSGEIMEYALYDRGILVPNVDQIYPILRNSIFKMGDSYSGVKKDIPVLGRSSVNGTWVFKNGYLHGIHQFFPDNHRIKYSYHEYIILNGQYLFIIFYDKQSKPLVYLDMTLKEKSDFVISDCKIKGKNVTMEFYIDTSIITDVPMMTGRTYSYKFNQPLFQDFYYFKCDTLYIHLDSIKPRFIKEGFVDRRIRKPVTTQYTIADEGDLKFIDDTMFPGERKTYCFQVEVPKDIKPKWLLFIYNEKERLVPMHN